MTESHVHVGCRPSAENCFAPALPLSAGPAIDVKTSSELEVKGGTPLQPEDRGFCRDEGTFTSASPALHTAGHEYSHTTVRHYPKETNMATGISLFFLAVGAILTFAIDTNVSGVDLDTIGVILMVIGLLGMLFSLVLWDSWTPRRRDDDVAASHRDVVIDDEAPVRRSVSRRVYR
jgi:hypothetical protein